MKKRNPYLTAGLILTGVLTGVIILGFFWTPYDPNAMAAGPKLAAPSLTHLMGTDSFGRDIFSRVLKGAGTTFCIALATVAIGSVCGVALGAVTGYFGGLADDILMRLGDVLTAFPSILLALVVISLLGPGKTENVIIALGLVFIPSFARVTRGAYAGLRDVNYVKSARLMGASSGRILWRQHHFRHRQRLKRTVNRQANWVQIRARLHFVVQQTRQIHQQYLPLHRPDTNAAEPASTRISFSTPGRSSKSSALSGVR